ncbi:SDR family oxidoreductase [Nonomuraea zeae]|uniref:SDR family oxidoreductase n=1 Tax=Nonomuraea zeae TaxID=1642303 RepID=A0A5S4GGA6_9ACTN|nr:SDR family oxidoreductase [Nonomuraea zeae]TMR31919.1 SDR family oxidoreductase [Nonomuraea zeae]
MTVTYDYTGKSVLVTGGTKGIGAGIARAFREAGADVTVCARTPAPSGGMRFVRADVRAADDVERLIAGFERLDVVVNNAGGTPHAPLAGTSPRLHARVIELNLTAPLLVSQYAYPLLAESGGAIVMIGSASGARPSPGTSAYGAAKAGLHHLARCLAAEWAPLVRVNTVIVGLADTGAETGEAADHYGGHGDERIGAAVPAGRMATPADVAQACLWLAAPGYVTGAQVRVDGGGEIPAWSYLARRPDLASDDIS